MKKAITPPSLSPSVFVEEAVDEVRASFERPCLRAGLATLCGMMEEDVARLCSPRHSRGDDRSGHSWGKTKGKIGFHGDEVEMERPRVRVRGGDELALPSWAAAVDEDLLGQWVLNLMLMNVDPQVRPRRSCAGRRHSRRAGRRRDQIGGVASVRGLSAEKM